MMNFRFERTCAACHCKSERAIRRTHCVAETVCMYGSRLVSGVTNAIQGQGCLPASIRTNNRFRGRRRSAKLECNCRGGVCESSGPLDCVVTAPACCIDQGCCGPGRGA